MMSPYGCVGSSIHSETHGPVVARRYRYRLRSTVNRRSPASGDPGTTKARGIAAPSDSKPRTDATTISDRLATWRQNSSAVASGSPPDGRLRRVSAMRARSRTSCSVCDSSSRSWLTSRATSTYPAIEPSAAPIGEVTELTL